MSYKRGIIATYTSGVDLVVEWKIENFFNLSDRDGTNYLSPDFSFGGETWYLDICPNGSSGSDSSGHVDLRLWIYGSDRPIKQSFSLSLKTAKGEKYNEQNVTKEFEKRWYCHSFIRFIQRSDLTRRKYELVPDGVLTVVCTMKSSASAGSASNTASTSDKCCHCKITFNAQNLSSHQKRCMHRPIKCPDCLEVVVLQKWLDEHECQKERSEACVEACTQTQKHVFRQACTQTQKHVLRQASTQTVEEKYFNCREKLLIVLCIVSILIAIVTGCALAYSKTPLSSSHPCGEAVTKIQISEINKVINRSEVVEFNEFDSLGSNETGATDIKQSEGLNETSELNAKLNKADQSEIAGSEIPEASAANQADTAKTDESEAVNKIQTSENNKANNRSDVVGSKEFEASSSNETSTTDIKKWESVNKTLAAEMNKTDQSEIAGSDIPEASAANEADTAETDESEPLPQPVLMVTEVGSTYLEVAWVLSDESKTKAAHIHYIVLFRKCETQWQEVSFLNASRTSYSLTNLNSGMPYQIYVMAVDSRFSRPSEIATVRTSDKVVNHSPTKGHGKHILVYAATIIILVIVIASVYSYSKTSFSALHHYGVTFNNPPEDCGFVTDINHLLNENRGIDVTFELETPNGKTKLFAHKLILAVMSSYFADEFYDKGRNKGHQVIPLNGIDPKAFEQMIRYCYGGKPSLITTEEVCALFKVAFEFKVISLQNLCHTFFKHTKIEPGNVFSILKISMEMEDKNLKDMCYQILQEKTREVMTAYELCDITPAMVYTLLKLPKLSLNSEYELIKWIFEWAKVKSENAREYLERLLKDMNFLALRFEEFATLCKDYQGFFNSDEIASIYQNIAHAKTREMPEWFNNDLKCRVYTGSN